MKKLVIPIIILVMLSACSERKSENINQPKELKIMEKQDKQQIERLLAEYKNSLNTSDAALAQSLYAKDGVFMPTGAPSAIGSENILKSYQFIFSQIQLNIEFYIDEIVVDEDIAFATTSSKGTTLIHASGQTVPEENRELFVFEKIDGAWKIARYMFNKTK
ncbi:SgcJ/EcaC family oxidoreductase [bacterium]|nr:SgcJ/EcaC family oxidoreductase [bacterium]